MEENEMNPAAKIVSDTIFMKAHALKAKDLAEIEYTTTVEMPNGTKVTDSGTLRSWPGRSSGNRSAS